MLSKVSKNTLNNRREKYVKKYIIEILDQFQKNTFVFKNRAVPHFEPCHE